MSLATIALLALSLLFLYLLLTTGHRPANLPPGPPTLPIIGNLHQIPLQKAHLQFQKWAEQYGPIYSLILGTKTMIILNTPQATKDLLDKRSSIYSSRPELYLGQVVSGGLRMAIMPYGETWRLVRGLVHAGLNPKASWSYAPYQDLESRALLMGLLGLGEREEEGKDGSWSRHLKRYSSNLTTQILFGWRGVGVGDERMEKVFRGLEAVSEILVSPTANLIEVFPFLKHIPAFLLPAKKRAQQLHKEEEKLFMGHWLDAKKAIQEGKAMPCLSTSILTSQTTLNFSDKLAAYTIGTLLEAGADTTYCTLLGFVQAMVLFPKVAKTAQEELDRVCGDRFPTLEDEMDLQYVRGCVKESCRWMPTVIMGVPHAVTRENWYQGYRIPEGAGVMWNVWTIHNDPTHYANPRTFEPLRYKTSHQTAFESSQNPDPNERDHFLFGAGRRICQGIHLADRSLFLGISRLLWAFDFLKEIDENGEEITPDPDELTEGVLVRPKDIRVRIVPRSERKAVRIREEWDRVNDKLNEKGQWKEAPEGMLFKEYVPL